MDSSFITIGKRLTSEWKYPSCQSESDLKNYIEYFPNFNTIQKVEFYIYLDQCNFMYFFII